MRATGGFLIALGIIGWLTEGGYRLFDWAERHSAEDRSAPSFPVLEEAVDTQQAMWHKLRWLWTPLIVAGVIVLLISWLTGVQ